MIDKLKNLGSVAYTYLSRLWDFLQTEEGRRDMSLLPLFFNWLYFLWADFENETIRKSSIYSMLFSAYFFLFFFMSVIFNNIPFIGSFLANFLHLAGILIYAGLSCFFIYSYHKNKSVEIQVIDKHYQLVISNLI